jgi:hypothetical protein
MTSLMQVRCIDNNGVERYLSQNGIYYVSRVLDGGAYYKLLECDEWTAGVFDSDRFEVMQAAHEISEEERIWQAWKKPQAGCCPCNIPRETCKYHS